MANKRIFYAVQQVAIAPIGTTSYTTAHTVYGLQSVGMNTRFNLEQVFEIGQISIYQNLENIPDVEITLEKVLDGKPLIYHLATRGAPAGTLTGRSNVKSQAALSIFSDIQDSASGTPLSQVECSGMFVSSESFNFRVDGQFTEACTLVGNNKLWRTAGFTYNGVFPNNDSPTMPAGVARRQHFIWGSGNFVVGSGPYSGLVIPPSILPIDVDGIDTATGYNLTNGTTGDLGAHVQSIRVTVNLGRDSLNELGRKGPYHRFVNFPVEVRTDIEVISTRGDMNSATEAGVLGDGNNLAERPIFLACQEGTKVNLGNKNKLNSVTYGGANAGGRGGNATCTYSFTTFNDFSVVHPSDPTPGLSG